MSTKQTNSLKRQVYDSLFSDIIKGVYSANFIFTEKFLMEKYKVSRAPIREALMEFTGNHILVSMPRQGYKMIQPSENRLFELVKFRSALETSFLENYYYYIKESDIAVLRELCQHYDALPTQEFLARWSYNCEFHIKLFSLYGNEYAEDVLTTTMNMQSVFYALKGKVHAFSIDFHRAMLDYVEKGEIALACNLLKADIESILCNAPWVGNPNPQEKA